MQIREYVVIEQVEISSLMSFTLSIYMHIVELSYLLSFIRR